MSRILAICGSLAASSANRRLLEQATSLDPRVVIDTLLGQLPLFDPTMPPTPVSESWRGAIEGADAVLIASPEYGHSLPGALKNGIDHVIGTGELYRKPVAITAAVRSRDRGLRGLDALRTTLLAVDAQIVWDETILVDEGTERLEALLGRLALGFDKD